MRKGKKARKVAKKELKREVPTMHENSIIVEHRVEFHEACMLRQIVMTLETRTFQEGKFPCTETFQLFKTYCEDAKTAQIVHEALENFVENISPLIIWNLKKVEQ